MNKKRLLILWIATIIGLGLQAQRVVTGTVKNKGDNSEIQAATVMVVGTNVGTKTDGDGNYKLIIPESMKGALKLKASYIGMKNSIQSLSASADKMDFTLEEDRLKLDEVVVTALSIKREKRSLGYSTVTVKGDDVTQAGASSALTGLQGKTTGATITNNGGTPGSSTSILLRGPSSFTGNNQALIVVDGVPISNTSLQNSDNLNNSVDFGNRLNDLNPNDIESMTVLKGAEGAALYGSLAANGVVIITTKSAKKSTKKGRDYSITVNSDFKFQNPLMLPELQTSFGQGGNDHYDSRENWSWGPKLDGFVRPWGNSVMLPDANGNLVSQIRVKPFSAIANNLNNGFNTGKVFTNDVNLMKSFEKIDFYFSYQNQMQEGIVPGTGLNKNSFRLNTNLDLTDKFKIQLNMNYVNTLLKNSIQGQGNASFYNNLLQIPVDIPLSEIKDLTNPFNNITNYYGAYTYNPYQLVDYNKAKDRVNRFFTSAAVTYNPMEWLSLTNRLGLDYTTDARSYTENKFTNTNQNPSQSSPIGKYAESITQNTLVNNDLIATVNKSINKDLDYSVMLGFNTFSNIVQSTSASTAGLAIPGVFNLGNSDGRPSTDNTEVSRLKYGIYGAFDINYKDYFYVQLTGRQDWASTLPANKRSYFYPGINSSFIFTEILKDPILTFGKLRASWAQIGNDAPANSLTTVFIPGSISDGFNNSLVKSPFIGSDGSSQIAGYTQENGAGNPDLRPEIVTSWEIGTELGFFKDRLGLDLTLYNKVTTDAIVSVNVSPSTGFTSKIFNAGKMTNNGYEIAFRATPIVKSNFKLDLNVNFSQNENIVNEVYPGVTRFALGGISGASTYIDSGSSYGTFYASGYDRADDGRMVVDAVTGLPVSSGKLVKMGTYLPKYTMGIGASVTLYKRIKASILFDYKNGGVMYSRTKDIVEFLGSGITTVVNDRKDYVIPNTVNMVNGSPVVNTTAAYVQDWMTQQSDAENNMVDATYFKLRELSVGYSVPMPAKYSKYVKSIDLSLYGNNLMLWVPESNKFNDPETNSFGTGNVQGIDYSNIPSVRSIGGKVKLTF